MVTLHHVVSALIAPLSLGILSLIVAALCKNRAFAFVSIAWLWLWSSGLLTCGLGRSLEGEYPAVAMEDCEKADVIVCLGGGMVGGERFGLYPDMQPGADRVWHAARLWKAGKAPLILCTSQYTPFNTATLLADMGVPTNAVVCLESPRNTEQEAREVRNWIASAALLPRSAGSKPRILLVTSAWHMRRAMFLFTEVMGEFASIVPAPCDHESTTGYAVKGGLSISDFWPDPARLMTNSANFKEIYAYYGYRIFGVRK